ncbi:MAG: NrdH-redoxin [Streptosporangiales bacterium]|nr:NrdH-redoxin [Streptosporangiales bacterium]
MATNHQTDGGIVVYGTGWCPDVAAIRSALERAGVAYTYYDIDTDKKAQKVVRRTQRGGRTVPMVTTPAGAVMIEPTPAEVLATVESADRTTSQEAH